ncbi:MAG: hypothetical protein AAFP68_21225 [Pseudomonadota bacterium]
MKTILIAAAAVLLAFGLPPVTTQPAKGSLTQLVEAAVAEAGPIRRTARRTARRTTRRVERRQNFYPRLPGGCARALVRGTSYWRCGSVYYGERIRNGATVYVIVTP